MNFSKLKLGASLLIAAQEDKTHLMPLFKKEKGGQQTSSDQSLEVWAKGKFSPYHIGDVIHVKAKSPSEKESFEIFTYNKGKVFADGKHFASLAEVKAFFKKNWPEWFAANKQNFPQFK